MNSHRIVVAITGASGTIYGIRALEILSELGIETHLILSRAARITMELETDWTTTRLAKLASACYAEDDIAASVASGSFPTHGMVVVP
ncbi:MAG: aromatic acid decarboxylase, partial [Anaerolineales bacterium]|nr:aromatic acid decarboxylase [Anaerolineales bacterium]